MAILHRFAAVFVLLGAPVWAAQQKTTETGAHAESDDSKKVVSITGGLSGTEVASGSAVQYWVTVENRTNGTLENVSVQVEVSKDEFLPTCRLSSAKTTSPGCGSASVNLEPNRAITIQGELYAVQGTETRNIDALVTYDLAAQPGGTSLHSERALTLGPLVAKSWPRQLYDNFKELILPLTLALVGYLISRSQEERAQVSQTWNNMLPVSHKMATQYYTPMLAAVQRVFLDSGKFDEPQDSSGMPNGDALSLYFHLLLTWRRYDRTIAEKGGIYFKSRMGEMLVLQAISEFRKAYKGETTTNPAVTQSQKNQISRDREFRVKAIFRKISPQMDLSQFMEVWEQPEDHRSEAAKVFHAGWADFCSWYTEQAVRVRVLALLRAFALILDFEMNRPYNKWYNSQEKLVVTDAIRKTLQSMIDSPEYRTDLEAYLQAAIEGKPI
jgi:hypothetical protein